MPREVAALYNAPKPRQEWIDGQFVQYSEDEEAWVELFIDLVYVVLLSKLADIGENCMRDNPFYIFKMVVIFCVMCMTRQAIDEYSNRFYSHDLTHKAIYLIYTIGVFSQVLNISVSSHGDSHCSYEPVFGLGMAVGVLITRVSLIAIYLLVVIKNTRGQRQFIFDLLRFIFSALVMIISIILNSSGHSSDEIETALLGVVVLQELVAWVLSRLLFRNRFTYPIDLDLMQSRWGTWVMIVIGEAIIQMLYQSVNVGAIMETYGFCIMSVILMFSLAMQYYDACQCEWYNHALTKSALAGILWIWLHIPMTYFLFGVGGSLKILIHSLKSHHAALPYTVSVFSNSLGLTTLTMTWIRLTNVTLNICQLKCGDLFVYCVRLCVFAIQFSVYSWFPSITPFRLVAIHMAISLSLNVLDIVYDIYVSPKAKRVFSLSTRVGGMGLISRKTPNMSMMSSRQPRRPSRPWATANLAKVKSDKSESSGLNTFSSRGKRVVGSTHSDNSRGQPTSVKRGSAYRPPHARNYSEDVSRVDDDVLSGASGPQHSGLSKAASLVISSIARIVISNKTPSAPPEPVYASPSSPTHAPAIPRKESFIDHDLQSGSSPDKQSVASNTSSVPPTKGTVQQMKNVWNSVARVVTNAIDGDGGSRWSSLNQDNGSSVKEFLSERSSEASMSARRNQVVPIDDDALYDNPDYDVNSLFVQQTLIFDGFMYRFIDVPKQGPDEDDDDDDDDIEMNRVDSEVRSYTSTDAKHHININNSHTVEAGMTPRETARKDYSKHASPRILSSSAEAEREIFHEIEADLGSLNNVSPSAPSLATTQQISPGSTTTMQFNHDSTRFHTSTGTSASTSAGSGKVNNFLTSNNTQADSNGEVVDSKHDKVDILLHC